MGIEGKTPVLNINGKQYIAKLNKTFKADGQEFCVLSRKKAYTAFKIDGKLIFAKHGGVLYKDGKDIVEEYWTEKNIQ